MTADDPFGGRKDLKDYMPAVPRPGMKLIPFERIKHDDQVAIHSMTIFRDRLFVATDKGLYEYDPNREVLRPVIFQDN